MRAAKARSGHGPVRTSLFFPSRRRRFPTLWKVGSRIADFEACAAFTARFATLAHGEHRPLRTICSLAGLRSGTTAASKFISLVDRD